MEISVILPVYNVADYIDCCMESLLAQTFGDFEALLIDDGSTDSSGAVCEKWAAKDPRVRVIHKENGGVSSARNRGIEEAKGKWLAFVDPDDWLDPAYLETLLRTAEEADADFCECDLYRVDGRTGKKIHRSSGGWMGIPWTKKEHMKYAPTASYKAISKRSLWIDNHVRFPDCAFESPAVYALVYCLAERTAWVGKPLYYYRRFRAGSLIENGYAKKDGAPNNTLGIEAMAYLTEAFRKRGLADRYGDALEGVVKYRLSDILATQFYRKSAEDYAETAENFRRFLGETFPAGLNVRYVTFGGYNLNRILAHMAILHDPYLRFNFMSIAALAYDGEGLPVSHPNRYREMMLRREEDGAIWEILRREQPAFFILDLLEERFDLLRRGSRFVTKSDARDGAVCPAPSAGTRDEAACPAPSADAPEGTAAAGNGPDGGAVPPVLRRTDPRRAEVFADAAERFFRRVKETVPGIAFIIVENYLAEEKGTPGRLSPYADREEIRAVNRLLAGDYRALSAILPEARVVRPMEEPALSGLLFTDEKYEYGAVPSHLNEIANLRIGAMVERLIGEAARSGNTGSEDGA